MGGRFFLKNSFMDGKTKMPKGNGHPFIHLASIQKIRPKIPKPIQNKPFCIF